jgi:methylglutaconyl-CoA hydratase
MADEVLFALDRRGVATLTLNRTKSLNAFDAAQIAAFNDAMARAVASPELRVIVIAGAGPIFCSGADIRYLQWAGTLSPAENLADARLYAAMAEAMRDAPVPVVGRVHGGAYGGGLAIAAACDIVLAAESAKFAITEARYGLTPSLMVPFLIGRIGQRGCRRWCLTGETMSAAEAQRIGLADIVVADAALDDELATLVDGLLMNAPGGLAASKKSIDENARPPLDRTIHERALATFAAGRASAQAKEGTAAFVAKRPPRWAERG